MIDDPLKHGPERETVMPAERRRKADDGDIMWDGGWLELCVWVDDGTVEMREDLAVSSSPVQRPTRFLYTSQEKRKNGLRRCSSMVRFIHNHRLQTLRIELRKPLRLQQSLIRRNSTTYITHQLNSQSLAPAR